MQAQAKLYKNAILKLSLNIFNICMPIIVSPYILRILGPEKIGVINYVEVIYTFFFAIASFGIYNFGIREVSFVHNKKDEMESLVSNLFLINFLMTIVGLVGYLIITRAIMDIKLFTIVSLYGVNLFSNIFCMEWINEGLQNYKFITIKTLICRIVYVILIFGFVKYESDYLIYVFINVLFLFINNIMTYIYIKRKIKFNFKNLKLISYIKILFTNIIIANFGIFVYQFDKIILGIKGDIEEVAVYSVSNMIMFMIFTLGQSLMSVSIPMIGSSCKTNVKKILSEIYTINFLFIIPISTGLFLIAKEFLFIYAGEKYLNAELTLKGFSIFLLLISFESFIRNQILYVNNKDRELSKYILGGGILNIILNYFIVFHLNMGASGVLITSILSLFLILNLELKLARKCDLIKINLLNKSIKKYFIASSIFVFIKIIILSITSDLYVIFLAMIVVCPVVYILSLYYQDEKYLKKLFLKIKVGRK